MRQIAILAAAASPAMVALLSAAFGILPVAAETDPTLARIGDLAVNGRSGCTVLTADAGAQTFVLDGVTAQSNCFLVPGDKSDTYRLTLKGSVPNEYKFSYLITTSKSYLAVDDGWDETVQGLSYCAEGGSILYFDLASSAGKEVTFTVTQFPTQDDPYCCVKQPIFWSDGSARCPSYIEAFDSSVCWSTQHYFLRADSLQYTVARPDPLVDSVVSWRDKDIANNCRSIDVGPGTPVLDTRLTQNIATSFRTIATPEDEKCIFLEIVTFSGNAAYWAIKSAGICNGAGDYELFTEEEISTVGLMQTCLQQDILKFTNSKGSEITFTNFTLEVFLPWINESGKCPNADLALMGDPTFHPSALPTVAPSTVPSTSPSGTPSTTAPVAPTAPPTSNPPTEEPTPTPVPVTTSGEEGTITYVDPSGNLVTIATPETTSVQAPSVSPVEKSVAVPETSSPSASPQGIEVPTTAAPSIPSLVKAETIMPSPSPAPIEGVLVSAETGRPSPAPETLKPSAAPAPDVPTEGSVVSYIDGNGNKVTFVIPPSYTPPPFQGVNVNAPAAGLVATHKSPGGSTKAPSAKTKSPSAKTKSPSTKSPSTKSPSTKSPSRKSTKSPSTKSSKSSKTEQPPGSFKSTKAPKSQKIADGAIVANINQAAESTGMSTQALAGVIVGVLLSIFLCVNLILVCMWRRRRSETVNSFGLQDPVGSKVTVEDIVDGRVMVKKIIPLPNGEEAVQKTMYPNQKAAAKALKGYDNV